MTTSSCSDWPSRSSERCRPTGGSTSHWKSGPEDYRAQYKQLWKALTRRADRGLPTIVVAGDVHHHSARTALDRRLAEFVCSPMALIDSLDYLELQPVEGDPESAPSAPSAPSATEPVAAGANGAATKSESERGDEAASKVGFNVKSHTGFSKVLGRLKRGKTLVSQMANNGLATVTRRDRKPLRYRDSARRHPIIDDKGRLTYSDGTQLFPLVNGADQAAPKVGCSGLASLDLDLDGRHPVIRYRAELDNTGISNVVPRNVDITLRWTGTRWDED